ncbi:MAG: TadA family conjugal transfer-associated ATPase [Acidothermus sp.]|nr:TadA family conjugal transfer-associated ATPase [Acidothermus sp.]
MIVYGDLVEDVRHHLAREPQRLSRARVASAVAAQGGAVLGAHGVLRAADAVHAELAGAGVLEQVLREPGVTDVLVNGPDEIWVDRGTGLERVGLTFRDEAEVRRLAVRLAVGAGRRLDAATPFVDAWLPGGVRIHAVLPPIAATPYLSLRIPSRRAFSLDDLQNRGMITAFGAELLKRIIGMRLSFLVTGETGSGKTTLLGSLLGSVAQRERIVIIEDVPELQVTHPHVLRLQARPPNTEGAGGVDLSRLVREALRMRPDRLIVGEVRGPECVDLLAALNVGHDGCAGTLHANAASAVPARLEALATAAGLNRAAVHSQIAAGLHAVVHLKRDREGRRKLAEVGAVHRLRTGLVEVVPALVADDDGELRPDVGFEEFGRMLGGPAEPSLGACP